MVTVFGKLQGTPLQALEGRIGQIREFYFDDEEWKICYLVAEIGSWLRSRRVLISSCCLAAINPGIDSVLVKLARLQIRRATPAESKKPVSQQQRKQLGQSERRRVLSRLPGFLASGAMTPSRTGAGRRITGRDRHLRSSEELRRGYRLRAFDGEIGTVRDFIIDDAGWVIRYVVIDIGLWFTGKQVLLPTEFIDRISFTDHAVLVRLPRFTIENAPKYNADQSTGCYEASLIAHWREAEKIAI